jgi:hypothetical protein
LAYNYAELGTDGTDFIAHNYGAKAEAYIPTKFVPAYASASYSHTHLMVKTAKLLMTMATVMHLKWVL